MLILYNNIKSGTANQYGSNSTLYTANDEMFVAWNGPELGEADIILWKALDLYFSGSRKGIHFKTNNLFVTAGPTVKNILNRKNKFNIY